MKSLVPAHPGSPGQRVVKWMCVYYYIRTTPAPNRCLVSACSLLLAQLHVLSRRSCVTQLSVCAERERVTDRLPGH